MKLVDILDEIDRCCMCYEKRSPAETEQKKMKIESCLDNYNNTNHSYVLIDDYVIIRKEENSLY